MDISELAFGCLPQVYINILKSAALEAFPTLATQVKLSTCRVQLKGKLGEGGAADVFRAKLVDEDAVNVAQEDVALKKVMCPDDEQLHLAEQECELMRKHLHPNIMPLLDSHTERVANSQYKHVLYMLMPLYSEGSLWDVVQERSQRLSSTEILSIIAQVAGALAALHEAGFVHRDVKPHNVLVRLASAGSASQAPVWNCVLTDLGSCCRVQDLKVDTLADVARVKAAAEMACSPLYRPPELYEPPRRSALDGRCDVWALGCLLYFLMMSVNPIEKQCQQGASLVLAVARGKVDWSGAPEPLNPDLQELVHACLRPNFEERPTSADVQKWIADHSHVIVRTASE